MLPCPVRRRSKSCARNYGTNDSRRWRSPPSQAKQVAANDEQIEHAIEDRIGSEAALRNSDVDVEVEAGVARLKGTVNSRSDQVMALTVARSTPGVQRVIDELRLATSPVSSR